MKTKDAQELAFAETSARAKTGPRTGKSISARFMATMLPVLIIGMGLATGVSSYLAAQSLLSETLTRMEEKTSRSADQINAWLDAQKSYVTALSLEYTYDEGITQEAVVAQNKLHVDANEQFFDVYIGLPSGEAYFASGFIPDYAAGWSATKRPWYTGAAANSGSAYITPPYTDVQTGGLCITAAKAIMRGTSQIGVVGADVLIDYLDEIVATTDIGQDSYAFITDREGCLLIHPNPDYGPDAEDNFQLLSEVSGGVYRELLQSAQNGEQSLQFKGVDGIVRYYTNAPIASTDWLLFTAIPASVVTAPMKHQLIISLSILAVVLLLACVILYRGLGRVVVRPVLDMTRAAHKLAQGDTRIELGQHYLGEIGILAESFRSIAQTNQAQALVTKQMATGDLSVRIPVRSESDAIGQALREMNGQLSGMIAQIEGISAKVAGSSAEVANASQALAQGSMQQAETVTRIGQDIAQIQAQNRASSDTASDCAARSAQIAQIAKEGHEKLVNMMTAMQDIAQASASVGNVIKVIDDIAFQTNILALNAAVESARAGQHGKGFAVVANEVRSLAAKSAEAAHEVSELVSANIRKSNLGLGIARETTQSLSAVSEEIGNMAETMQVVAGQSRENHEATERLRHAVEQVSIVTQQNSATSEESAATSEEMKRFAGAMQQLVEQFRLQEEPRQKSLSGTR